MADLERNLTVFQAHCLPHGHDFEAYDFSDFQYGERIIRTMDGQEFGLMAIDDEVVDEIESILADINPRGTDEIEQARRFDQVFGLSCDSLNGKELDASVGIICPACKTSDVDYRDCQPPRHKRFLIPVLTHDRWRSLTKTQRRDLITKGLRARGEMV